MRREEERGALLRALAGVDRLVLLGDVLELRQGPMRDALAAARPVLGDLAQALGDGGEVVLVPGNHDHHLVAAWLERRGRRNAPAPLGLGEEVDWRPGEPLAMLVRALRPAQVRVQYPGAWLREDVYVTHGHYCDRHTTVPMLERLGAGAMARIIGESAAGPRSVDEYEAVLAPIYAWIDAVAQHGGPGVARSSHGASSDAWRALSDAGGDRGWRERLRGRGLVVGFGTLIAALNRSPLGPLRSDISGPELRRAALRAFGEVLVRLNVRARFVVFGHTHRAGPLPRERHREWTAPSGARLLNTGSWVHEPAFVGSDPRRSPYRPGFCAVVEGGGPPELRNLLDRDRG